MGIPGLLRCICKYLMVEDNYVGGVVFLKYYVFEIYMISNVNTKPQLQV